MTRQRDSDTKQARRR